MEPFGTVVDEYDSGRPGYPDALYEELEPLAGMTVLEGGAGTGIATVSLLARGARVVPFDIGMTMLVRAMRKMPGVPGVVADGAAMPFRDECADLMCFAQSWHWLDEERRAIEAARVLRPGGRWAGWWSHARADGEPWFMSYWEAIEAATVARREERDTDWGADLCGVLAWSTWMNDGRSDGFGKPRYSNGLPTTGARATLLRCRSRLE